MFLQTVRDEELRASLSLAHVKTTRFQPSRVSEPVCFPQFPKWACFLKSRRKVITKHKRRQFSAGEWDGASIDGRGCFPGKSKWPVRTESSVEHSIFRVSTLKSSADFQSSTGSVSCLSSGITTPILSPGVSTWGTSPWTTTVGHMGPPFPVAILLHIHEIRVSSNSLQTLPLKGTWFDSWYNFFHQETPDGSKNSAWSKCPCAIFPH